LESVWKKIYKKHEGEFKEAFQGLMQKESFKNKLLSEFKTNTLPLEAIDDLKNKSKTIFGKAPESIGLMNIVDFNQIITIEEDDIWGSKIIGKSDVNISHLIQKLNINDWVNQGRSYIQDNLTCPFCQQPTIEEDFKI
jgi:wobble nucleotide-excising tRNase